MTWLRKDDKFPEHRKIRRLTDGAYRLHDTALCACAKDETDGLITEEDLDDTTLQTSLSDRAIGRILRRLRLKPATKRSGERRKWLVSLAQLNDIAVSHGLGAILSNPPSPDDPGARPADRADAPLDGNGADGASGAAGQGGEARFEEDQALRVA